MAYRISRRNLMKGAAATGLALIAYVDSQVVAVVAVVPRQRDLDRVGAVQVRAVGLTAEPVPQSPAHQQHQYQDHPSQIRLPVL